MITIRTLMTTQFEIVNNSKYRISSLNLLCSAEEDIAERKVKN